MYVCVYMYWDSSMLPAGPEPKPEFISHSRTFRLWLDTNQYQMDMARVIRGEEVGEGGSLGN